MPAFSTRNPNLEVRPRSIPPRRADDPLVGPRPAWWWTGLPPRHCPGVGPDGALRSLSLPNLETCTRREALDYFENGWTLTELLFASLNGEDAFLRMPYHGLRHPLVFHYAHPAALYVNKLRLAGLLDAGVDAELDALFETGVDEMSWDDVERPAHSWPNVRSVTEYRRVVHRVVRSVIETHDALVDGHALITWDSPAWALFLGFEHERIHLETSSVLIRETPIDLVRRPERFPQDHPSGGGQGPSARDPRGGVDFPHNDLARVPAGRVRIGKPRDWPSYGWDNEQ